MCLCHVFVDEQAKREIKDGILVASVQLFSNNKLAITFTFSGCTNKRTNFWRLPEPKRRINDHPSTYSTDVLCRKNGDHCRSLSASMKPFSLTSEYEMYTE
jgi:hypothetical protein